MRLTRRSFTGGIAAVAAAAITGLKAIPAMAKAAPAVTTVPIRDLGHGWLACNGATVTRAQYPALVDVLAGIDAHEAQLPDLRGQTCGAYCGADTAEGDGQSGPCTIDGVYAICANGNEMSRGITGEIHMFMVYNGAGDAR